MVSNLQMPFLGPDALWKGAIRGKAHFDMVGQRRLSVMARLRYKKKKKIEGAFGAP